MVRKNRFKPLFVSVILGLLVLGFSNCGGGGGDSGGGGGTAAVIDTETATETTQFTINAQNVSQSDASGDNTGGSAVKNTEITHLSGDTEVAIDKELENGLETSACFSLARNADGSLRIFGKNANCELKVGDIFTINADGFSRQQIIIDEAMLETFSANVKLKEVGSTQTFQLDDLANGRITATKGRGAYTVTTDDKVTFKTTNNNISLTVQKARLVKMARRVLRTTKATADTEVTLEMTTIDPKTERESAIGDFSYDPCMEVGASCIATTGARKTQSGRSVLNTNDRASSALESVVMANIEMKTDEGEIDCFSDGAFNADTQKCDDEAQATLRVKIPASQFSTYSDKYNLGDRLVPLYSYRESSAQWVRQTDGSNDIDAELVLEDNNQNGKADEGDVLYMEGSVGHFSYWNGDYPMERSCLTGTISRTSGELLPSGTQVVVEGADYTGRVFRLNLATDADSFGKIAVKTSAKAQVYLLYPNGAKSDIVYVQTGDSTYDDTDEASCQNSTEPTNGDLITLVSEVATKTIVITVTDLSGKALGNAALKTTFKTAATNASGKANLVISKTEATNLSVSYQSGSFITSTSVLIPADGDNTTVAIDTSSFTISGGVTVDDASGAGPVGAQGSISISVSGNGYTYGFDEVDSATGLYSVQLPKSAFVVGGTVTYYTYAYSSTHARYLYKYEEYTLTAGDITAGSITNKNFAFVLVAFTLSGQVTNPLAIGSRKGVQGVSVWSSSGAYATTDENGFYQMTLFQSEDIQTIQAYDNYMFQYATPQDGTGSGNVTIFDNVYYKNFVIAANQTASAGFNFTVDRVPATLTGKILSQRGVPVPNIKVFWSNGWEFSVTDSAGNFEINTLQEGLGRVYLYGSGWTALEIEDEDNITWPTLARGTTSELGELKIFANIEPIITGVSFSPSSPAVGQELEITVDATDPDNDTVLYSFEDPLGSAFTTVTDSTIDTLAFEPSTQGWIKVKITADDGQGSESTSIEQWVYIRNNPKPEIRDISGFSTSWKKDAAMNVLVDAFDPLGEHLTYAAILIDSSNALVDALTVGRDDGSIVIDHTQVANGDYTLTITISDGVNEITASLKFRADDNTPPVINYIYKSDATADVANNIGEYVVYKQGSTASLIVDASDNVSVDNIEWKLSPLLTGVAPSTTNITGDTITFDIDEPGFYSAGVIVSDSMSLIDSKPFSIIVQSNLLPEISSAQFNETKVLKVAGGYTDIDGVGLTPNDTLILSVSASDPDGSAQLTFAFDSIVHSGGTIPPSTASVVATQDASTDYELTGLNPGRYAVKYTVTDGDGGAVSGYAQFQVTIDNPPFVTDFYVPFQRTSNKSVDLRAIAQDPEGKALSFTWSISYPAFDTSNEDATFDSIPIDTATDSFISFRTPTLPGDEGYVTINLDVSDGSLSTTLKRTMKIVKDTPPNIGFVSVFPSTVNTGGELYLEANAYDIDGGLTKIEWYMMDASADLSTATTPLLSELNGTPTLDASTDAGNYLVWLLVSDGNTDVSSDTIAITVVQANSPPATPTISTSGVSLVVGETTTISAVAIDGDGDTVSYKWLLNDLPYGTDADSFDFSSAEAGTYVFTVKGFDGEHYSESASVTIIVQTIELNLTTDYQTLLLGNLFTFSAAFSDTGYTVDTSAVWSVISRPTNSSAAISGTAGSATFTPDRVGAYTIRIVTTLHGETYQDDVSITATTSGDGAIIEGTVYTNGGADVLSGIQVRLYNKVDTTLFDQTLTTDALGGYQFTAVPAGEYFLVFYAGSGYQGRVVDITITDSLEVIVNMEY